MATRLPAIALSLALTGCAGTSAEILIGDSIVDRGFVGHGPTATLRVKQYITDRTWCEFEHVSYLTAGVPFGDRMEEDALNQLACGIRFDFKRTDDAE